VRWHRVPPQHVQNLVRPSSMFLVPHWSLAPPSIAFPFILSVILRSELPVLKIKPVVFVNSAYTWLVALKSPLKSCVPIKHCDVPLYLCTMDGWSILPLLTSNTIWRLRELPCPVVGKPSKPTCIILMILLCKLLIAILYMEFKNNLMQSSAESCV